MPGLVESFRTRVTESLPMQDASRWRYAPVTEAGNESSAERRTTWRAFLTSKPVWRTVIALVVVALLADFFHPTRTVLEKHGWVKPGHGAASGGAGSGDAVNWGDYAYCQYVTTEDYLCNSVMIFESLTRLGAKADKIMMYPHEWIDNPPERVPAILQKAKDEYQVKLIPIVVERHDNGGDATWAESFTKLLAFNQTQYKRVLSLDSDATVLQPMDELFLLPSSPVAMPRAYWLENENTLSSQLLLVEPSTFEFDRILNAFANASSNEFDMEIVNNLYGRDCFIIPHRKYDLLTGEFRSDHHRNYLGSEEEVWDPDRVLNEAKFLHFSDWPVPKPWVHHTSYDWNENVPKCHDVNGVQDCRNRNAWIGFYDDFQLRRKHVCGASFINSRSDDSRLKKRRPLTPPSRYEPIFG